MWFDTIDGYAVWLAAAGRSPQTIRVRRSYLRRLASEHPSTPPAELTVQQLAGFLAHGGWAPETRKSARASVCDLYHWLELTEQITTDPTRLLSPVKVPAGKPRPTPPTVLERALARADDRTRLMVMLAAYAGLRRAEIAGVHTEHIEGDVLRVDGKGGRVRIVPLNPELLEALAECPRGWVFPSPHGEHLGADAVGKILKRALGEGWTAHTLRHRFASRAYAGQRDLRAVQELLGHSKPETTARYVAVPDGALRAAVMAAAAA
jgi:integrase/recombinase XerC